MVTYWSSYYCPNSPTEVTDVITNFPLINQKSEGFLYHLLLFPVEHSAGISQTGSPTDFYSKIYKEHSVPVSFI